MTCHYQFAVLAVEKASVGGNLGALEIPARDPRKLRCSWESACNRGNYRQKIRQQEPAVNVEFTKVLDMIGDLSMCNEDDA
jgi:hypothetical protein